MLNSCYIFNFYTSKLNYLKNELLFSIVKPYIKVVLIVKDEEYLKRLSMKTKSFLILVSRSEDLAGKIIITEFSENKSL